MISHIILTVIDFYVLLIFIYILMSWLPSMGRFVKDVYDVLGSLCNPYLDLFRRIIPSIGGSGMRLDISPIFAVIVLQLVGRLVASLL